ncbi:MAG: hypothetical protein QM790_19100 [Nibricoccus sp.]
MQLKWMLSHTRGYLELGMVDAAAAELERVPKEHANNFEVRVLQALIFQERKDWTALTPLAAGLTRDQPQDAGWWIMWAYATRRADSLAAAEKILLEAESNHPTDAMIKFNLGCYACQLGDLPRAQAYVDKAIALDERFREAAAKDSDLEPLRLNQ